MKTAIVSSLLSGFLAAGIASAQEAKPGISFSGYVDADFVTTLDDQGKNPLHTTGLEIDLTTTVTFSPKLNAVLYTTMNDGIVPAQGANRTWDDVNFDGVTLNWLYDSQTTIYIGDIIYGTGYFNYYGNKRTALVVGEHAVRGVGFSHKGLTVSTGVTNMGAVDMTGAPVPSQAWGTFAKYDWTISPEMTLTPSAKYVGGIPGSSPLNFGLSFDGKFSGLALSADVAGNLDPAAGTDPGFALLLEPLYSSGSFSLASTFFYKESGANPGRNIPQTTLPADAGEGSTLGPKTLDDILVYVEPGLTLSENYAIGLPVEYHEPSRRVADNEFVAVVPTFYVYPGSGVQWWIWAGASFPVAGTIARPYSAGSEIIFKF